MNVLVLALGRTAADRFERVHLHVHFLVGCHLLGILDKLARFVKVTLCTFSQLGTCLGLLTFELLYVNRRAVTRRAAQRKIYAVCAGIVLHRTAHLCAAHINDLVETCKATVFTRFW